MGRRSAGWREDAASALLAAAVPSLDLRAPALVMGDARSAGADALARLGLETHRWSRRVGAGAVSAWPPRGPFSTVALRLPRAKAELEMTAHAALASLLEGGTLLVYGAKDEGIGSAAGRLEPLGLKLESVAVGKRCRVLAARRPTHLPGLRATLSAWGETTEMEVAGRRRAWVSYPGVFSHGRLDAGTALLLDVLAGADLGGAGRALDYGCGSGVIAATLEARAPDAAIDALDHDAVALEAARVNVPGARVVLADGWPSDLTGPYDLVVSNPPLHEGKKETLHLLETFVAGARVRLAVGGRLWCVTQRRVPFDRFVAGYGSVRVAADDGRRFRVWELVR